MGTLLESLKQDLLHALELLALYKRMNNETKIYETAKKWLGHDASPKDQAPNELACAESVSAIVAIALPELNFHYLSTHEMCHYLLSSPSFAQVSKPSAGDIIISPTGTGTFEHGHVGIVGKNPSEDGSVWVMSNDSRNGLWSANYTLDTWHKFYGERGGMPVLYFAAL